LSLRSHQRWPLTGKASFWLTEMRGKRCGGTCFKEIYEAAQIREMGCHLADDKLRCFAEAEVKRYDCKIRNV